MSPEATVAACLEWKVTYAAAVPTIWQVTLTFDSVSDLVSCKGVRQALLGRDSGLKGFCVEKILCVPAISCSSLSCVLSGGGSMPPAELMAWYLKEYGTQFLQGFGMTETNPNVTIGKMIQKYKHRDWSQEQKFANCARVFAYFVCKPT